MKLFLIFLIFFQVSCSRGIVSSTKVSIWDAASVSATSSDIIAGEKIVLVYCEFNDATNVHSSAHSSWFTLIFTITPPMEVGRELKIESVTVSSYDRGANWGLNPQLESIVRIVPTEIKGDNVVLSASGLMNLRSWLDESFVRETNYFTDSELEGMCIDGGKVWGEATKVIRVSMNGRKLVVKNPST